MNNTASIDKRSLDNFAKITTVISNICLIVSAFQLNQYFTDDTANINWLIIGLCYSFLLISLFYVGFKKDRNDEEFGFIRLREKKRNYRYGNYSKVARIGFIICVILGLVTGYFSWQREILLNEKNIILFTNISGPSPDNFRVTYMIYDALSKQMDGEDITINLQENINITKTQGSEKARRLGRKFHADWVIWGWYGASETNAKVEIHLENLNTETLSILNKNDSATIESPIAHLNTFEMQQEIGDGLGGLLFFIDGLVQYFNCNFEDALDLFSRAKNSTSWLDDFFGREYVYMYLGSTYYEYGGLDYAKESIINYTLAIDANPDIGENYYNRGLLYFYTQQYPEAIDDFDLALSFNKSAYCIMCSYFMRGNSHSETDNYPLALADFDEGIKYYLESNDNSFRELAIELYLVRGFIRANLDELDLAITDFEQAIMIDPTYAPAYTNRGIAYTELGEADLAKTDFEKALSLDPESVYVYINRGALHFELGEIDLAMTDFDQAIMLDPENADAYYARGVGRYDENEIELAKADYDKAILLGTKNAYAYVNRGVIHADFNETDQAIADFEQAIMLDPENALAYMNLADIYWKIKNFELATINYQQVIKFCGGNDCLCSAAQDSLDLIP